MVFAEHASRLAHEDFQKVELALRELQRVLSSPGLPRAGIDGDIAPAQHVLFDKLRTAQLGLQPRDQLFENKGFDQIVIGAGAKRANFVFGAALCGEHEDWSLRNLAQSRQERDAIDLGHHDVEHYELRIEYLDELEGGQAIGSGSNLVALAREPQFQHLPYHTVVVDDRNAGIGHNMHFYAASCFATLGEA